MTLGWLVRGMHKWGASVFIILMFLHMARTFLFGAYKYPRELNWIIGVLLLVIGHGRGLHRLPAAVGQHGLLGDRRRDQHQRDRRPSSGPFLAQFLQGVSRSARTRCRSSTRCTCSLLPGAIMALIGLHLYLVVRLGVSSPPWSKTAAGRERPEARRARARA